MIAFRSSFLAFSLIALLAPAVKGQAAAGGQAGGGRAVGARGAASRPSVVVGDFSSALVSGAPSGWQLVKRAGAPDIRSTRDGSISAIAMRSFASSFGVQRSINIDLRAYPVLSWRWRADVLPAGGDFRKAASYDMAGQIYVAFSMTRIIGYVWDSTAPAGAQSDALGLPPFTRGKIIVVRSGTADLGRWLTEERNLLDDYRSAFGEEPPTKALGIRLHISSQHTLSTAVCAFANLAFLAAR